MPMPGRPLQLPGPGPIIVVRIEPEFVPEVGGYEPVDPMGASGFFGM